MYILCVSKYGTGLQEFEHMLKILYKNIKMNSFKSSENIQNKEGVPDRCVSDNQSSSVTLNELAMKARKNTATLCIEGRMCHHPGELQIHIRIKIRI